MLDENAGEPPESEPSEDPRSVRRRPRLLIAIGVVVAGTLVTMLVALSDDGGDSHPGAAGSDVAKVPGASAGEPVAARPAGAPSRPAASAPKTAGVVSGGGGAGGGPPRAVAEVGAGGGPTLAAPGAGGAGGGPGLSARNVAGSSGHTGREAGGRASLPVSSAAHPAVPLSIKPDGGAAAEPPPDGGVRTPDRARAGPEAARRPGGKAGDDRDQDGEDLVLVPRFVPSGGAMIEGRVVDADGGRPVPGIAVEARHAGKYMKGTTDAGGSFRMAGLVPGSRVVVWIGDKHDPYVAERIDVAVPGEGQKADIGRVRLLRGDEMGPRLDGWVGLFVTQRGGRVTVSAVSPWLPADHAGVKVGDVVVSINGRDTAGFGPRAATYLLRGAPSTSVSFVVEDHTASRRKLTLDRVPR